jgi:hypothetical protein
MNMAISKWVGLAVIIWNSVVQAEGANYELGTPFPIACEGILVSENGIYGFVEDDKHLNSGSDDDIVCLHATIAEKSNINALKYSLKDKEISRILKTCSVGKLCRIEGYMNGLTHDVYFFVKIDSVSAK